MRTGKFTKLVLLFFGVWLLSGCGAGPLQLENPLDQPLATKTPFNPELQPGPDLGPEDVVRIQVEALKRNDEEDNGIEITFRFASPSNKQATGPLFRFAELVRKPAYRPLLNHKLAEYGPINIDGDTAEQRVTIIEENGEATVFLFALSRQTEGPCKDCWMTDSVTVVPTRSQNLQGI
jgi:hypothetical protein